LVPCLVKSRGKVVAEGFFLSLQQLTKPTDF
jgi:hypothetical protein